MQAHMCTNVHSCICEGQSRDQPWMLFFRMPSLIFVCLFVWGCILLLILSRDRFSLNLKLTSLARPAGQCTLLSLLPGPKIAGACPTASFFMWVLEIKLWPRTYAVRFYTDEAISPESCLLLHRVQIEGDCVEWQSKWQPQIRPSLQWQDQTSELPFSLSFLWVLLGKTDSLCTDSSALCKSPRIMDLCRYIHFPKCKLEYLAYLCKICFCSYASEINIRKNWVAYNFIA